MFSIRIWLAVIEHDQPRTGASRLAVVPPTLAASVDHASTCDRQILAFFALISDWRPLSRNSSFNGKSSWSWLASSVVPFAISRVMPLFSTTGAETNLAASASLTVPPPRPGAIVDRRLNRCCVLCHPIALGPVRLNFTDRCCRRCSQPRGHKNNCHTPCPILKILHSFRFTPFELLFYRAAAPICESVFYRLPRNDKTARMPGSRKEPDQMI